MTKEEIIRRLKYTMEKHKNDTVHTFDTNISVMCKDILDYLEQEPKTGHWIEHEIEGTLRWLECSNCHYETYNVKHNYCMNCGIKMEVEEQNNTDHKKCKYYLGQIITMGKNKKEYEVVDISKEPWIEFDDGSMHYGMTIKPCDGSIRDVIFLSDAQIEMD